MFLPHPTALVADHQRRLATDSARQRLARRARRARRHVATPPASR